MRDTALVLSGGGAGGAFQIGVLKKIWYKEKERIASIYGTSVGALNGAALRQIDFDSLEKIWLSIRGKRDVLRFNYLSLLGLSRGKYNTKPLKALINNLFEKPAVNNFNVYVSAVNLSTGKIKYFHNDYFVFPEMVLASASVPFHMEPFGDWVDGGVRDHTPISRAIEDGYKRIIVICCNPWDRLQHDYYTLKWPYLVNIGLRATDILQSEVLWNDLEASKRRASIVAYAPDKRIIDTFEYDPIKIRAAISQGENQFPFYVDGRC